MFETLQYIFEILLYKPLLNALILIYESLPGHDFGIAVIFFTIAIRFMLYPIMAESIRTQKKTVELQPKMKEIQQRYKNDKEKQALLMMELWKKEKINPFSSILLVLIQLPILIALYQLFWRGFRDGALDKLYSFMPHPQVINTSFLGIVDLSEGSGIMALVAGIFQYLQTKAITAQSDENKKRNAKQLSQGEVFSEMFKKQSLYFFPVLTVMIFWSLPSALSFYWIITSIFSIVQQRLVFQAKKESPAAV